MEKYIATINLNRLFPLNLNIYLREGSLDNFDNIFLNKYEKNLKIEKNLRICSST
jgi:hypothetical protein